MLDSVKIEGRAKSAYYAAIVTGAYRHCIDDVLAGRPLDPVWRAEVEKVSHRHYSTGFFYGQPGQFTQDARYIRDWQVVAEVVSCDQTGLATASLRNKFAQGDAIELVGPDVRPVAPENIEINKQFRLTFIVSFPEKPATVEIQNLAVPELKGLKVLLGPIIASWTK